MAKAVLDELTRDKGVLNQKNIIGGYHIVKNEEERLSLNPGVLTLDGTTIVEEIETGKKYQFTGKRAQNKIDNWTEIVEEKEEIEQIEIPNNIITEDILDTKLEELGFIKDLPEDLVRKEEIEELRSEISKEIEKKSNSSDTYTKNESEEEFVVKTTIDSFVTEEEINTKGYITKSEADIRFVKKEELSNLDFVLKTELNKKVNTDSVYTKENDEESLVSKEEMNEIKRKLETFNQDYVSMRNKIDEVKEIMASKGIII